MNSKSKIELYKIRTIGSLISDTVSFVKEHFKPLFTGLFYICSPVLLLSAVCFFLFFKGYLASLFPVFTNTISHSSFEKTIMNEIFSLIPYMLLMFLGIYIVMCQIVSVSFSYIKLYKEGKEINTNILWNTSKKYIWKIIVSQFLLILVILAAYIICFSPILLFYLGNQAGVIGILFSILFSLAFSVGAFYFYVKLSFNQHFIVVEDKGIIESFKLSYKFSKGIFWKTFLTVLALSFFVSICGNVLQMPGIFIMYLGVILGVTSGEDYSFIMLLGTALISLGMILSYMLYCVIYISISFIYYSTIEERYGVKAQELLEDIGKKED